MSKMSKGEVSILVAILIAVVCLVLGVLGGYYLSAGKVATTTTTTEKITTTTKAGATTTAAVSITTQKDICLQLFPNDKFGRDNAKTGENFCEVEKVSGSYALGGEGMIADNSGGGPGATWLAVKTNSKWTEIQHTQDMWDCSKLRANNVPKSLLGTDSCYNYTTQKQETY